MTIGRSAGNEQKRPDRRLGKAPADELCERVLLDPLPELVIGVDSIDQLADASAVPLSGLRKVGETFVTERREGIVLECRSEGPVSVQSLRKRGGQLGGHPMAPSVG